MPAQEIGYRGELLNLLIRQGATLGPFAVTLTNPNATQLNLTGSTLRAQVRKKALDATPVVALTCTITNAAAGQFTFGLTAVQTAGLPAGELISDADSKYVWDMELEDVAGTVFPLYFGDVQIFREVTRP